MTERKRIVQPRTIRLEASTVCQLKCRSCPTAAGETAKTLGRGFLKADDFQKLIDGNPWVAEVELANWGEVFLNRELIQIMKTAHERNVALSAYTGANFNHVDQDMLEALVRYRFRKITCSLDGASQETYSLYRVGGDFRQVIENVQSLNRLKARHRSPYPLLHWQFIAFGHNEHEIGRAKRMAAALGMKFYLKLSWEDLYTESFSPIKDADLIRRETGLGVATRGEFLSRYGKVYERSCCLAMWKSPQVNYDGRVLGCPVNYWGDYGNAFHEGLLECLNNEKMNDARAMLMGRQAGREDVPCALCRIYQKRKENGIWMAERDVYVHSGKLVPPVRRAFRIMGNTLLGNRLTNHLSSMLSTSRGRHRRMKGDL